VGDEPLRVEQVPVDRPLRIVPEPEIVPHPVTQLAHDDAPFPKQARPRGASSSRIRIGAEQAGAECVRDRKSRKGSALTKLPRSGFVQNLIDGPAAAGIRVSNTRNVRIVNNVLRNLQKGTPYIRQNPWAVQGGVSITGCRNITIAGNTVDTCGDRAILCRDVADVEITNNEFSGIEGSRNKGDAPTVIYVSDGRNVRAVGNRVSSSNAKQTLLLERCMSGD